MKNKVIIAVSFIIVSIIIALFAFIDTNGEYVRTEKTINNSKELYTKALNYLKEERNKEFDMVKDYDMYIDTDDHQTFYAYHTFATTEDGKYQYAYIWILDESYYVYNHQLYSDRGSSVFYKFTFEDGNVIKYDNPMDGSFYQSSLKKMCPKKIYNKVYKYEMNKMDKLSKEIENQYKKHYSYLKSTEINYR